LGSNLSDHAAHKSGINANSGGFEPSRGTNLFIVPVKPLPFNGNAKYILAYL
jgi:hypothetical protein